METTRPYDLLLRGAEVATPSGLAQTTVAVRDGRIVALGVPEGADAVETLDLSGLHVLPGVIDTQVHFREPGLEHKEDLESGTRGAVLGGVTAIFEMPNTTPNTDTPEALADKLARAQGRAWCDHAFFIGATDANAEQLGTWEGLPGCAGVKVFMGASTGSLLVEDDTVLGRVLAGGRRRVAVHAEDEARLRERKAIAAERATPAAHPDWRDVETAVRATQRLLALACETRRRVHVLHITTAEEMELLAEAKDLATVEVTPQHLTLTAPDCYERLGSLAQMNPPIREARHREALWRAVAEGVVDVIGSDHAPHTREEKARPYPASPSGMPGVQTLVPVMLDHVNAGRLSLQRFIDLTNAGPARIYNIAGKGRIARGYDADFTVVDLKARRTIEDAWMANKSGWTPYHGLTVTGWPMATIVRGRVVMREGELSGPPAGAPVRFQGI
ncbi:dihydroorotase [Roseospira marina]|uniref:Dihydroorotase n=1 Tax=Roseospira marina TaxID=140057 RepID=A0A5M6IFR7_9PROT|nr:dihydroorotase [Roseospira marina]KAA5607084.1 dihydroorotase [Roseospira marina]MBB4312723.1 dihydroorotase [Roseospira marina]MBB5086504.1 dihydroorotase [Roseospira marina]